MKLLLSNASARSSARQKAGALRPMLAVSTSFFWASLLAGCASQPLPVPVAQATSVAESSAAEDVQKLAPQAFAEAEKLRAEALWLHEDGRLEEASVAGEEALAAYSLAFTLARAAQAEVRIETARRDHQEASSRAATLDAQQARVAADADAYEMRARVHLDTETVKDVDKISPERAQARRLAAKRLTGEAELLCLATQLLNPKTEGLSGAQQALTALGQELSQGSEKNDLYPRASQLRADCLTTLTKARRPKVKAAPDSAASDKLLTALTETGRVFAYRDDRGIVVSIAVPLDREDKLTEAALNILKLLGGTAHNYADFPVIVVSHTAKSGQEARAQKMNELVSSALKEAGAANVSAHSVNNAQPVVSTRVSGAAEKNERVEIIFVNPGR